MSIKAAEKMGYANMRGKDSAHLKNSKPDGNVAAALKKRGQKHGIKTLAESAKSLYPSSK